MSKYQRTDGLVTASSEVGGFEFYSQPSQTGLVLSVLEHVFVNVSGHGE